MVAARKGNAPAFRYTSLCRFFMSGKCDRGDDCVFAHDESQLREKPNLFKTRVCRSFARTGRCKDGDACKYAHSQDELRSAGTQEEEVVETESRRSSKQSEAIDSRAVLDYTGASELSSPMMEQRTIDSSLGFCGGVLPQQFNGYQIVGWMPANMACVAGGEWQEEKAELGDESYREIDQAAETGTLAWDPAGDSEDDKLSDLLQRPEKHEAELLSWDPIGMQQAEGSSASGSSQELGIITWDPLGMSMTDLSRDGLAMFGIDASVLMLAARTLGMGPSEERDDKELCLSACESVFSTRGSEGSMSEADADGSDDEEDSVFEAWAAGITDCHEPLREDVIMHKGIGYELGVRNTFLSFGPAPAKRIMLSKSRSMPLLVESDA